MLSSSLSAQLTCILSHDHVRAIICHNLKEMKAEGVNETKYYLFTTVKKKKCSTKLTPDKGMDKWTIFLHQLTQDKRDQR